MSQTYSTRDGDTVDFIAWKQYGTVTPSILATVLDANRGLADLGPVLPVGTVVVLPDIDVATDAATDSEVSLWT